MTTDAFAPGLRGHGCWLETHTGERQYLPVQRWSEGCAEGDAVLLDPCSGPTLDIGCGPGRLTEALGRRGIPALGVDTSPVAVSLTLARGATALQRDVFDRIPGEGRWHHAILADGNIGIGGDPVRLLRRVAALLGASGTVVVETDPPGSGLRTTKARVTHTGTVSPWFPWSWLGSDALPTVAEQAGLSVRWTCSRAGRWFAELGRAR